MSKKPEHEVFLNIFKLALEFSRSNSQILNELSHYLVDNLISKICILIAQEKGLSYSSKPKSGRIWTFNFDDLYKNILMPNYQSIPDYDTEIKSLHKLRNIFQHSSESITLSIRPEYAKRYVEITENILKEIGIVDPNEDIEPSSFLKGDISDESVILDEVKNEALRKKALIELEELFERKCGRSPSERKHDPRFEVYEIERTIHLDMLIKVVPMDYKDRIFDKTQYANLKRYLERSANKGPYIDSKDQASIFGELAIGRGYLAHISDSPMIGTIFIKNNGLIIYNWRDSENKGEDPILLQDYYMCAYFLGFIDFLYKFYTHINYSGLIEVIFEMKGLRNWNYSPISKKLVKKHYYSYNEDDFEPIKKKIKLVDLEKIKFRFDIVKDLLSEVLLGYGFSNGYKIPDDFIRFYQE